MDCYNEIKGGNQDHPGIFIAPGETLTIDGTGSLTASSNGRGAGIGGGCKIDCGNIVINGGGITAAGGSNAAGIGSGGIEKTGNNTGTGLNIGVSDSPESYYATASVCESITITDGVTSVTATKG